jgi:hypothetical protein
MQRTLAWRSLTVATLETGEEDSDTGVATEVDLAIG